MPRLAKTEVKRSRVSLETWARRWLRTAAWGPARGRHHRPVEAWAHFFIRGM